MLSFFSFKLFASPKYYFYYSEGHNITFITDENLVGGRSFSSVSQGSF